MFIINYCTLIDMIFAILIAQKQWNNSKQNKRIKDKASEMFSNQVRICACGCWLASAD